MHERAQRKSFLKMKKYKFFRINGPSSVAQCLGERGIVGAAVIQFVP